MIVTQIKTSVVKEYALLEPFLDKYLADIEEGSILAITSKIVSIFEGNIRSNQEPKDELIKQEADLYIDSDSPFVLTIKNNILIPSAGIDESNSDEHFILWPKDPFTSAKIIREYIANKCSLKNFGVIITDSKTSPLRYGVTGIAIAHAGFAALKDYRQQPDIFGRKLKYTQANHADALAVAAVLVMGEGNEITPMVLIKDLPFVKFASDSPTKQEIKNLKISMSDDLYGPLLSSVTWEKGK